VNELSQLIAAEIRARGAIPLARFMELALYAPKLGYYEREMNQIGRRGDFFTSVSVGSLFGEMLAYQFARWAEPKGASQIVEAGAHDGTLANDILETLEGDEPDLFGRTEYWIVEPSESRRAAQQGKLVRFSNVRWFESISELRGRVTGVVFSNELLDAMPAHPFLWNVSARQWEELGVTFNGDALAPVRLANATVAPPEFPQGLLDVLPDGYVFEVSPAASKWWSEAALALSRGRLMTIDYGGVIEELLNPARTGGTLRGFGNHRVTNVLSSPGEQDITAHVNFSEIVAAGERAGLKTETFTSQSLFLTTIMREMWQRRGSWPQDQVGQFQTLTHPEHLGRPFRVLVQSR
jgi:SAM-dependent MidA family methyltransferase